MSTSNSRKIKRGSGSLHQWPRTPTLDNDPVAMVSDDVGRAREVVKLRNELESLPLDFATKRRSLEAQLEELRENFHVAPQDKPQKHKVSDLCFEDVSNMGILQLRLEINDTELNAVVLSSTISDAQLDNLCSEITCIISNFGNPATANRIMLRVIILAAANIGNESTTLPSVAIVLGLGFEGDRAVFVEDPATKTQFSLSGDIDYLCSPYTSHLQRDKLVGYRWLPEIVGVAEISCVIVEAKGDKTFDDNYADAAGQAVAVAATLNQSNIRYCSSNGEIWAFCIFSRGGTKPAKYEGYELRIDIENEPEHLRKDVKNVLELLCHWMVTSVKP